MTTFYQCSQCLLLTACAKETKLTVENTTPAYAFGVRVKLQERGICRDREVRKKQWLCVMGTVDCKRELKGQENKRSSREKLA